LKESDYLFVNGLVQTLEENTTQFLKGELARLLLQWGVAPKRGVLLHGKPGNGKTVLSRLTAKRALEAGVNVVYLDVDTLFEEDLGEQLRLAASRSPVIVIIDDLDVHCGERAPMANLQDDAKGRQRFLADLLEFLDGVQPVNGYVLLATANNISKLDASLTRAGRLDVHIVVNGPPADHRRQLLEAALSGEPTGLLPDVAGAVELLEGCSYADVAELGRRYKIGVVTEHGKVAVDQTLLDLVARRYAEELGLREITSSGEELPSE
jgi:ATP-dependent 26S proteasome regulatory subunit